MHFKQLASLAVLPLLVIAAPTRLTVSIDVGTSASPLEVTQLHPGSKTTDGYGNNGIEPPTTTSASKVLELFSEYRKILDTTSKMTKALVSPRQHAMGDYIEDIRTIGHLIGNQSEALDSVANEMDENQLGFNRADGKKFGETVLQAFASLNETLTDALVQKAKGPAASILAHLWGQPLDWLGFSLEKFYYATSQKLAGNDNQDSGDLKFFQKVVDTIDQAKVWVWEARNSINAGGGWTMAKNENSHLDVPQWKIGL